MHTLSTSQPRMCDACFKDCIDPTPESAPCASERASTQTAACIVQDSETQAPVRRSIAIEACIEHEASCQADLNLNCDEAEATLDARHATVNGPSNLCLQHECTLSAFDASKGHGNKERLIATSIAWHPRAISIAVTLGVQETASFCPRGGALAIWNLQSENFQPASPHVRLEAECALQAAAYHPHVPALVVAGTANGGLHVWDLSQDSEALEVGRSASSSRDTMHWRSIRSVAWLYSQDEASRHAEHSKAFLICSVGREGRVLMWKWHSCQRPVLGLAVLASDGSSPIQLSCAAFPHTHRLKHAPQAPLCTKAGVDSSFLVGSQAGGLHECGLAMQSADLHDWEQLNSSKGEARGAVRWRPANAVRTRPIPKQPHVGEVSAVCYIPGLEHLFITAGMDGRVRLWNSEAQEMAMLEPFCSGSTCLSVCPHKPSIFAVASETGTFSLYDLSIDPSLPVQTNTVSSDGDAVCALAFSPLTAGVKWLAVTSGDAVLLMSIGARLIRSRLDCDKGKQYLQSLADAA
eukprot:jgi/Ulvmu1/2867/UM146_0009.1